MGAAFGTAIGRFAAFVAAGATVGKVTTTLRDFEASMSKVQAISGATGDELEAMRKIAKELGSTTEFTAAQAAGGLEFLSMAGFNAAESVAALPGVLDLATASGLGLAQASDIASNVMSGFGIAAEDVFKVTDVLAKAASIANTNVDQLGQAMSYVAPVSSTLGVSIEETAAAVGVLSDAGVQGTRAGTALRSMMSKLVAPTDKALGVLKSYGLTADDVNIQLHGMHGVMQTLADSNISLADATHLVGVEAASNLVLITENADKLAEYTDVLNDAEGATKSMAEIMRDNLDGSFKSLGSAVEGLIIAIGEGGLTDGLRNIIDTITDLVRGLTGLDNLPEIAKGFGLVAAAAVALAFPLMSIGLAAATAATWIYTNWDNLRQRFPGIIGTIETLAGKVAAGFQAAWGLVKNVANFGVEQIGLAADALDLWLQGDKVAAAEKLTQIMQNFQNVFTEIGLITLKGADKAIIWLEGITGIDLPSLREITQAITTFKDGVVGLAGLGAAFVTNSLSSIFEGFEPFIGPIVDQFKNLGSNLSPALDAFARLGRAVKLLIVDLVAASGSEGMMSSITGFIGTLLGMLGETAVAALNIAVQGITGLANALAALLEGDYSGAGQAVVDTLSNIWTTITEISWVEDGINLAKDLISGIVQGLLGLPAAMYQSARDAIAAFWEGWNAPREGAPDPAVREADRTNLLGIMEEYEENKAEMLRRMEEMGRESGKAFKDGMLLPLTDGTIQEIPQTAIEEIERYLEQAAPETGALLPEGISYGIEAGRTLVIDASVAVIEAGASAAGERAGSSGAEIGLQMASGIAQGIRANEAVIVAAVSNMALRATNTMKNALKIASPSRVFRDIGDNTAEGFIRGFADKKDEIESTMKKTAETAVNSFEEVMGSAIDSFAGLIGQAFTGQLDGIGDFFDQVFKIAQQTFAQIIQTFISEQIRMAFGLTAGATDGGAAGGINQGLGGAGGGGGLGGLLKFNAGGSGLFGLGGGTGFLGLGKGSGLANILSGGAGIGGFLGLGGLILGGIGLIGGIIKAFKRNLKDQTLIGDFANGGFTGQIEEYWGGNLLSGAKRKYRSLDPGLQGFLDNAFSEISTGVMDMAAVLGIGAEAMEGFSHSLRVSIHNMSEEEAQEAITQELEAMADAIAGHVLGTDLYIRANETALEALERMSQSLTVVNQSFDILGMTMFDASISAGDAASRMVDIVGGLDAFTQATNAFISNFYSQAEQTEIVMRQIDDALTPFGVSVPASRAEFRQLIEAIDTTTVYGQELYATLLSVADAFAQISPAGVGLSSQIFAAFETLRDDVAERMSAASELQRDRLTSARLWFAAADSLEQLLSRVRNTTEDNLLGVDPARLRAELDGFYAAAVGGDVSAISDFQTSAQTYLDALLSSATSPLEYLAGAQGLQQEIIDLQALAMEQGTIEEQIANVLGEQLEILGQLYDFLSLEGIEISDFEDLEQFIATMDQQLQNFNDRLALVGGDVFSFLDTPLTELSDALQVINDALGDQSDEFLAGLADLAADLNIPFGNLLEEIATLNLDLQAPLQEVIDGLTAVASDLGIPLDDVITGIGNLADDIGIPLNSILSELDQLALQFGLDIEDVVLGLETLAGDLGAPLDQVITEIVTMANDLGVDLAGLLAGVDQLDAGFISTQTGLQAAIEAMASDLGVDMTDLQTSIGNLSVPLEGLSESFAANLLALADTFGTDVGALVAAISELDTPVDTVVNQVATGLVSLGDRLGGDLGQVLQSVRDLASVLDVDVNQLAESIRDNLFSVRDRLGVNIGDLIAEVNDLASANNVNLDQVHGALDAARAVLHDDLVALGGAIVQLQALTGEDFAVVIEELRTNPQEMAALFEGMNFNLENMTSLTTPILGLDTSISTLQTALQGELILIRSALEANLEAASAQSALYDLQAELDRAYSLYGAAPTAVPTVESLPVPFADIPVIRFSDGHEIHLQSDTMGDPSAVANAYIAEQQALYAGWQNIVLPLIDQIRVLQTELGVPLTPIPSFARGGLHKGGFANIAEHDMELVAPSHIYSGPQVKDMLDQRATAQEVMLLRKNMEQMAQVTAQSSAKTLRFMERMYRQQQQWTNIGLKTVDA